VLGPLSSVLRLSPKSQPQSASRAHDFRAADHQALTASLLVALLCWTKAGQKCPLVRRPICCPIILATVSSVFPPTLTPPWLPIGCQTAAFGWTWKAASGPYADAHKHTHTKDWLHSVARAQHMQRQTRVDRVYATCSHRWHTHNFLITALL